MLRSMLGAAAAAVALSLTPHAALAARATPPDPLAGYELHPEWGSITGTPAVLRRGCRTYTYSYAITPPEGIWAIEVYITGPRLEPLAGGAFLDGGDPETGTGSYKLCRATTRSGTFKIQAKVSIDNGSGHITEGALPANSYVLTRPPRHHHHHR